MPRRLGQHFLIRTSILRRIAEAAVPSRDLHVVEIGPGRGALTKFLVPAAERVTAVEVDPVLVHYLQEKFRGEPNFAVLHNDILQIDLAQWGHIAVAGNLPYYITSPIVEKVLGLGPLLQRAVFLVQKEVGERITAQPGSREYGYLSVLCQVAAEVKYVATVPPEAFRPPPKVFSAVVQLIPRPAPLVADRARFLEFASLCFGHKRKTLRNNLLAAYPGIEAQPEAKLRAEQVGVEQMVDLWARLGA
jgi:16S rRNA (adenine1518-N6/adenine1519-N6)-dimethyltransferase